MYCKRVNFAFLWCLFFGTVSSFNSQNQTNHTNVTAGVHHSNLSDHSGGIHLFTLNFETVSGPFIVCVWVIVASLGKIIFHNYEWISATVPESVLLIILGIPIGLAVDAVKGHDGDVYLTSDLFFLFLLPPIILDAGYFMASDDFFQNLGTILLYAILGTIFNTFAVGASMYGVSGYCKVNISMLRSLEFGSLISAVDPVAVLAVFEEVQVNELLYMLVFGESVLNDAASVVLYRTFGHLPPDNIDGHQIGLAIASFLVVSILGTLIGVLFGLASSFVTKFTKHVNVIEPVFVFITSYIAYLTAEMFHFSGIMSILFCGLTMKPYVEANVSRKSHTTIKYFLKLLSSSCDAIIFMFLGESLVQLNHEFNFAFVLFTLLFITLFRAIGIVVLTRLSNRFGRLEKVKKVEQFIMCYGGLRGAVAFCLAIVLAPEDCASKDTEECRLKRLLVTTCICVVVFTVFVQGCTIKKMVEILGVTKSSKKETTMSETLNDRIMGYTVAGIENIIGVKGYGFFVNLFEHFNKKYIRRWLVRESEYALDEKLFAVQRHLSYKLGGTKENGAEVKGKGDACSSIELAIAAQQRPSYDGGFLDIRVLTAASMEPEIMQNSNDALTKRRMSSLIPKAKPIHHELHHLKTNRYNLDDVEDQQEREFHQRHKQMHFQMEENKETQKPPRRNSRQHRRQSQQRRESRRASRASINEGFDCVVEMNEGVEANLRKDKGGLVMKLPLKDASDHHSNWRIVATDGETSGNESCSSPDVKQRRASKDQIPAWMSSYLHGIANGVTNSPESEDNMAKRRHSKSNPALPQSETETEDDERRTTTRRRSKSKPAPQSETEDDERDGALTEPGSYEGSRRRRSCQKLSKAFTGPSEKPSEGMRKPSNHRRQSRQRRPSLPALSEEEVLRDVGSTHEANYINKMYSEESEEDIVENGDISNNLKLPET